jgi:outer membrane protein
VEKFKMKKSLLVVALLSAFAPVLAKAEAGDIVVRLRATNVNPNTKSSLGETTDAADVGFSAEALYGDANANLQVGKNTIPELDISYYLTKNIAAELILAVGTRHSVSVSPGTGAVAAYLGKVNLLPPTLTAQWHFNPDQTIDPYVGAGAAFVLGLDRKLTADATAAGLSSYPIRIDRSAFGAVLQAGFDVNLQDKWLINFDVKKIWVNTDVKLDLGAGYTKIDNLNLNPLVVSVGIGKKF